MTVHDGHRKRLRERYRQEGLDNFAPHEVLELLLLYARARGDVNPLAHRLLDTFGSLKGVLEAPPERLMTVDGVGEETATLVSLMVPMFRRYCACVCEEKKRLLSRGDAMEYCKDLLAGRQVENFYIICLNADSEVLGARRVAEGSLVEVPINTRKVVEAVLNLNAHGVLLCHNHPSGRTEPSDQDWMTTMEIKQVLAQLGVTTYDHVIVAGTNVLSMAMLNGALFYGGEKPMAIEAEPGTSRVEEMAGRILHRTGGRKGKSERT